MTCRNEGYEINLSSNENPFGPSPAALRVLHDKAETAHCYPDDENSELRSELADRWGLNREELLVTAGSTAFLEIVARYALGSEWHAITAERSFIAYDTVTKSAGSSLCKVPMLGETFDLDAIVESINDRTKLLFIANPNNPTGTICDPADILRMMARIPQHVLVILDEAYYDFAEAFSAPGKTVCPQATDLIREWNNLVVLRTFSKAHGLAGLRIGYGFASAALIEELSRVRLTFSVSTLAEAAAVAALRDERHVRSTVENNVSEAQNMLSRLHEMGFIVRPTHANFLYLELGNAAASIALFLREEKHIKVRTLEHWGIPQAIRVTIGTPSQNDLFLRALEGTLTARKHPMRLAQSL